ncbi:hypothetical protein [uncultured Lutibacter sp.]|uniref:hypothetical protein n=1 Tax=uncultured Lutibacter sp. TaxID=437739 RepID=UPI002626A78E|nr:hypothetical protein [uncultured Lutibacter sp.]
MKKILVYTILFLLISTGTKAQELNLGDIMGEAQEFFGEAKDKAKHAADDKAIDDLKKKFKNLATDLSSLDMYSPELKCIYLMIKYEENFVKLKKETNKTDDCLIKYDLYGMQLMAIASSTTIIYCTEGLYNLILGDGNLGGSIFDSPEYVIVLGDYYDLISDHDDRKYGLNNSPKYGKRYNQLHEDFQKTLREFLFAEESLTVSNDKEKNKRKHMIRAHERISYLLNTYFHPLAIIKESVDIGNTMSALPCSKG